MVVQALEEDTYVNDMVSRSTLEETKISPTHLTSSSEFQEHLFQEIQRPSMTYLEFVSEKGYCSLLYRIIERFDISFQFLASKTIVIFAEHFGKNFVLKIIGLVRFADTIMLDQWSA